MVRVLFHNSLILKQDVLDTLNLNFRLFVSIMMIFVPVRRRNQKPPKVSGVILGIAIAIILAAVIGAITGQWIFAIIKALGAGLLIIILMGKFIRPSG